MRNARLFDSFFMAGFECSTHRRSDGTRLDLIRATGHDTHVARDYRHCLDLGIRTVRDGLRWHLIEASKGVYDWSTWLPMLEAAAETGVQVVWDLLHYGSPDWIDQGDPGFISAYARFAAEAVRLHRSVTGSAPIICPINEISYFTWAAKTAVSEPWCRMRRACSSGTSSLRNRRHRRDALRRSRLPLRHRRTLDPRRAAAWRQRRQRLAAGGDAARPVRGMRLAARASGTGTRRKARPYRCHRPQLLPGQSMVSGRLHHPLGHHDYRPLSADAGGSFERYAKPVFLAETGAEGSARPAWLHYVCDEVREAVRRGAELKGICLYPVAAYPGWETNARPMWGCSPSSAPMENEEFTRP
jgi:hypothetical protein